MADGYVTSGSYICFDTSGPYETLGHAYAVLLSTYTSASPGGQRNICVFKGWYTDSGWTEMDTTNRPVPREDQADVCWDGRYIYVAFHTARDVYFSKFDTQTDTWVIKDIWVAYVSSPAVWPTVRTAYEYWPQMTIDSNGKLYVIYPLYSSKGYHRVRWTYSTDGGSTWTGDQTIPSTPGSKEAEVPFNIHADGTNIYMWYNNNAAPATQCCVVYNGSGWSSIQSITSMSQQFPASAPIKWSDSGTWYLTQVFSDGIPAGSYYSLDTTTGSSPNWTNKLTVLTEGDFYGDFPDFKTATALYDGMPIAFYMRQPTPSSWLNRPRQVIRTSYSSWGTPSESDTIDLYPNYLGARSVNENAYPILLWGYGGDASPVYIKCIDGIPPGIGGNYFFFY